MKKVLLASLLAFGLTSSAMASEDGSGAYFGAAYGVTGYANDDKSGKIKDDSDSGYKIYGGYQFNKIVGVEATYVDYGTFTYNNGDKVDANSFNVAANLGYTFLQGQLRPYGIVGLGAVSLDSPRFSDDSAVSFSYGVGIEYSPKMFKGVGFRAMWNVDAFVVDDLIGGDDHLEALAMFSAAVQYKF